jgi:2-oxoglutarate dehydrogenase E2 component (dihydrolipoamide succinyltransferase)
MTIELKVPHVGESIQEVQIGRWLKQPGDSVAEDENLVELETDKASLEVPAPSAGVLTKILKHEGDAVSVGDVIAYLDEGDGRSRETNGREPAGEQRGEERPEPAATDGGDASRGERKEAHVPPAEAPRGQQAGRREKAGESRPVGESRPAGETPRVPATPSARRALREHGLSADEVAAQGKQLRADDVTRFVEGRQPGQEQNDDRPTRRTDDRPATPPAAASRRPTLPRPDAEPEALEQVVPMSLIRRRIAQRLVEAQQTAALLTTFNEIDMSAVVQLRERHRDRFQQVHGVKLGFMSFFVKGVIEALQQFPALNAEIRDGDKIAYRNYYHIGVAIGAPQGLVVPVLHHAERLSFAEVERAIGDFAERARQKKLHPDELEGGTFTISNGGVYGSLLSTPIVNPPQSGVLGMHAIQERPVARSGQVVVLPMMYVALTYDHRIVDGEGAVLFLKRVKEVVEDPARLLIEV